MKIKIIGLVVPRKFVYVDLPLQKYFLLRTTRVNLFFPIFKAFMKLPHRTVGTRTLADHSCTADTLLWIVGSSVVERSGRSVVRSRSGDTDIALSLCGSSLLVCPNRIRYIHNL